MPRTLLSASAVCASLILATSRGHAQSDSSRLQASASPIAAGPVAARASSGARASNTSDPTAASLRGGTRRPWWAPLASLAVPGAGQLAMRQPRAAAYLGIDVYEWIQLVESTRDAHRLRAEYRRIAREVARSPFGGTFPDGPWAYYEAMSEPWYPASGRYSLASGNEVVPETDEATFNGQLWRKARSIYWADIDQAPAKTDAAYTSALSFYERQAVRDEYTWTWKDNEFSRQEFVTTIARYNSATRDVRGTLGVILANHLVSAIDAFATVRIRSARAADGSQRIDVTVPFEAFGKRRSGGR